MVWTLVLLMEAMDTVRLLKVSVCEHVIHELNLMNHISLKFSHHRSTCAGLLTVEELRSCQGDPRPVNAEPIEYANHQKKQVTNSAV